MKQTGIIVSIAAVAVLVAVILLVKGPWKTSTEPEPSVSSGSLESFRDFPSEYISSRTVRVWFPDGYRVGEECDVYYMHDGQMLFDSTITWNHQEWCIDEVMGKLMEERSIPRGIVVAIDNTPDRLNELFPDKACRYVEGADTTQLKGDMYLRFIVEELRPFINEKYAPLTGREHTFIAGSSMGGLISLYALCEYPDVFGGAACLSSHLSMAYLDVTKDSEALAEGFLQYVREHLPDKESTHLYMDYGEAGYDAQYVPFHERMKAMFREEGWDDSHYACLSFPGHDHMETFWAERVGGAIEFLHNVLP